MRAMGPCGSNLAAYASRAVTIPFKDGIWSWTAYSGTSTASWVAEVIWAVPTTGQPMEAASSSSMQVAAAPVSMSARPEAELPPATLRGVAWMAKTGPRSCSASLALGAFNARPSTVSRPSSWGS